MRPSIVHMHVDVNDVAWIDRDFSGPRSTGQDYWDVLDGNLLAESSIVRVLGTPSNAGFLVAAGSLWSHKQVYVAAPAVCHSRAARSSPYEMLLGARRVSAPPSTGGWHTLREPDCAAYALADAYRRQRTVTPEVRALFVQHPAYTALSFLPTMAVEPACRVLADWLDPRWCVDPANPDSDSALFEFLGLRTKNFSWLAHRNTHTGRDTRNFFNLCRAESVLALWYDPSRRPSAAELEKPGNFLWRIALSNHDLSRGLRQACRYLVQFVRMVWLQELWPQWTLFVPEYFFKTCAEVIAFRRHQTLSHTSG